MTSQNKKILALDLGGSKMLSAFVEVTVDGKGERTTKLSAVSKRPLSKDSGKEGVWHAILSAVDESVAKSGEEWGAIDRIGVTIPGVADPIR